MTMTQSGLTFRTVMMRAADFGVAFAIFYMLS